MKVGRMRGMASEHPYILNISDDVALTGRLLYLLDEPAIQVGADVKNHVRLLGLGIGTVLCTISKEEKEQLQPAAAAAGGNESASAKRKAFKITLKKRPNGGRLLVNGEELNNGANKELKHGDRIVFGRAFAFRLVMPGMLEDQGADRRKQAFPDSQFANAL